MEVGAGIIYCYDYDLAPVSGCLCYLSRIQKIEKTENKDRLNYSRICIRFGVFSILLSRQDRLQKDTSRVVLAVADICIMRLHYF